MKAKKDEAQRQPPEFARPQVVSEIFGISTRTLHTWIEADIIKTHLVFSPGRKRSHIRLVDLEDLRRFIRGQAQPGEAPAVDAQCVKKESA